MEPTKPNQTRNNQPTQPKTSKHIQKHHKKK